MSAEETTALPTSSPRSSREWRDYADRVFGDAYVYDCGFPECLKGGHDPMTDPARWSHEVIVDKVGECIDSAISLDFATDQFVGRLEFEGVTNDMSERAAFSDEALYFDAARFLMKTHGRILESLKRGGPGQARAAWFVRSQMTFEQMKQELGVDNEPARLLWLGVESYTVTEATLLSANRPGFISEFFAAFERGSSAHQD